MLAVLTNDQSKETKKKKKKASGSSSPPERYRLMQSREEENKIPVLGSSPFAELCVPARGHGLPFQPGVSRDSGQFILRITRAQEGFFFSSGLANNDSPVSTPSSLQEPDYNTVWEVSVTSQGCYSTPR